MAANCWLLPWPKDGLAGVTAIDIRAGVPVTVSVRLAERKMSLGAVVALGPGSLVTFNKSCEDLLDLYVNNFRYCRGEAVKIGENFGLKIDEVGVEDVRKSKILF